MKIKSILSVAIILSLLGGCISVKSDYCKDCKVKHIAYQQEERSPVTFSLTFLKGRNDWVGNSGKDVLIRKIKKSLEETGLFSSVIYSENEDLRKNNYHLWFVFYLNFPPTYVEFPRALIAGETLCTVPVWIDYALDCRCKMSLQGKPLYDAVSAERLRTYIWLPLIPFAPFLNFRYAWNGVEDALINNVVNSVVDEHVRRFAD